MAYAHSRAAIATPIGIIRLNADGEYLTGVRIDPDPAARAETSNDPLLRRAADQIEAYFNGTLTDFTVPLAPAGSARGQALREAIASIGYGDTMSYGVLARVVGSGPRAIGQACARNPFPIIIPCHRVLAAGGKLGPYSGGDGPRTKAWLLAHEQRKDRLI